MTAVIVDDVLIALDFIIYSGKKRALGVGGGGGGGAGVVGGIR